MTDDEADEQERAEAEALARALDAEPPAEPASGALETAAFLSAVAPHELSEERAKAVYSNLDGDIEEHVVAVKRAPAATPFQKLTWVAAGVAAAAAVAFYVMETREMGPGSPPVAKGGAAVEFELPVPTQRLLAAQAALGAKPDPEQTEVFESEMRVYRWRVLRRLKEAYPSKVGMLEPRRSR